jgi:hypothetical protein
MIVILILILDVFIVFLVSIEVKLVHILEKGSGNGSRCEVEEDLSRSMGIGMVL